MWNSIVSLRGVRPIALLLLLCGLAFQLGRSQNPVPAQPSETHAAADKNAPELSSHDTPTTFSSKVSLVMVPVVVRDRAGKAVGNLHQEDFALFDKGKPQVISKFSVERASRAASQPAVPVAEDTAEKPGPPPSPMATHFVAYLFDDVHSDFGNLAQARDAARKQITETIQPTDRIAIFSTSGQTTLDFTDDRDAIQDTLLRLRPRPKSKTASDCPDISYYMADLIVNRNDPTALDAATLDAMSCLRLPQEQRSVAEQMARSTAAQVLSAGDYETRLALTTLKAAIRRISAMPGQRTLVLVSTGFYLLLDHRPEETDVMDSAIRSNVTINTLDARGLYAPPELDASRPGRSYQAQIVISRYLRESAQAEGDVLGELADATGGTWFHNRNDLAEGFRIVAASPEFTYLLGFSPQNLKYDGSYHSLKVNLKTSSGLQLQARRGYYAPKHRMDPNEQAKEEVREALFSREEMKDIPVNLQTQFFKPSDISAKLSILAHVDLKAIRFRKSDGRNRNTLTVVSGVFDRNGILINAIQKTIEMFLKDETFAARLAAGLTIKTSFDVTPGSYVIRLVVRDTEGQMMTAQNGVVQVP